MKVVDAAASGGLDRVAGLLNVRRLGARASRWWSPSPPWPRRDGVEIAGARGGESASITSTFMRSSCLPMHLLFLGHRSAGLCSPSRMVVSKMMS